MKIKHLIKKFLSFLKSPVGYIGIKNYISYMNQTAKSLGMNDSFFDSASGASYTSYSTARDLFKLASEAFAVDLIEAFAASDTYHVNGHDVYTATRTKRHHPLLTALYLSKPGLLSIRTKLYALKLTVHCFASLPMILLSTMIYLVSPLKS